MPCIAGDDVGGGPIRWGKGVIESTLRFVFNDMEAVLGVAEAPPLGSATECAVLGSPYEVYMSTLGDGLPLVICSPVKKLVRRRATYIFFSSKRVW